MKKNQKKKQNKPQILTENAYIDENKKIKKSTGLSKNAKILLG